MNSAMIHSQVSEPVSYTHVWEILVCSTVGQSLHIIAWYLPLIHHGLNQDVQ